MDPRQNPFYMYPGKVFERIDAVCERMLQPPVPLFSSRDLSAAGYRRVYSRTTHTVSYPNTAYPPSTNPQALMEYRSGRRDYSSINSVSNTSRSSGGRQNTLLREGIKPFSRADTHRPNLQNSFSGGSGGSSSSSSASRRLPSEEIDPVTEARIDRAHTQDTNLGHGWYQLSAQSSGSLTNCGLHTVLESSLTSPLLCVYEAKTREIKRAYYASVPEYELNCELKTLSLPVQCAQIILGCRDDSCMDYFLLSFDVLRQTLELSHHFETKRNKKLFSVSIEEMKLRTNTFFRVVVRVKRSQLDVFLNGVHLIEYSNDNQSGEDVTGEAGGYCYRNFDGMTGLLCPKGSKLIFKQWKLKSTRELPSRRASTSANTGAGVCGGREKRRSEKFSGKFEDGIDHPDNQHAQSYDAIDRLYQTQTESKFRQEEEEDEEEEEAEMEMEEETGGNIVHNRCWEEKREAIPNPNPTTMPTPIPMLPIPQQKQESRSLKSYLTHQPLPPQSHVRPSASTNVVVDIQNNALSHTDRSQLAKQVCMREYQRLRGEHFDPKVLDAVLSDVLCQELGVSFDDIAGMSSAKRILSEAVMLPLLMPELFTGVRQPWKGVLLFGPPGTGKTMLAKAVADMSRSTFFSCSGASLISKYRGESEKIVQCLFECARICASQSPSPSIIFLDEVDAFVSSRSSDQEHEASRRLKTEFFAQMDGIASAVSAARVMVLSTTNCPWDLDPAILRRLEKRLLVPLPDQSARTEQFHKTLRSLNGSNVIEGGGISEAEVDSNMQSLAMAYAELTEGYSGADIHVICREASMGPIRRMLSGSNLQQILQKKQSGEDLETPHILRVDFIDAIRNTRPTVSPGAQQKYNDWNDKFGST